MATSSLARDFRKIDIEQYDEDFYVEDDYSQGAGAPDEGAVQMAISGGKPLVCFLYIFEVRMTLFSFLGCIESGTLSKSIWIFRCSTETSMD